MSETTLLKTGLAYLVPLGWALIAIGGLPEERAHRAVLAFMAAFCLSTIGYFAVGFALQFGGVGLAHAMPGLEDLVWEWSAFGATWGAGWGMAGLSGWALSGPAATPGAMTLAMANLPWVITATLIPVIALRGRVPAWGAGILGIAVGAVLYPVVGNWIWGGGWLANLGSNLGYGRGLVDLGGSGLVHLLGGTVTLAGLLVFTERAPAPAIRTALTSFPPVHLPLLATLGAGMLLAGSVAWSAGNPLLGADSGHLTHLALNTVLAAAAGSFLPLCYSWFVAGTVDPMMAVRGFAAGTVAIAAGAPLVPPWFALATGGCAGLLVLLAIFVVDRVLRWEDCTAALTVNGLAGALGLLAVGVFAAVMPGDLRAIGGMPGSSSVPVSGIGQIQAQLAGALAIALFAFMGAWVLIAPPAILAGWARGGLTRVPDGEVPALAVGSSSQPEASSDTENVPERSSEGLAEALSTRTVLAPDGSSELLSVED